MSEKVLVEMFDTIMHKPIDVNSFCNSVDCANCKSLMSFRGNCGNVNDKSLKQKMRNTLRREGYID